MIHDMRVKPKTVLKKFHLFTTDILVVGGGLAGCMAAIKAAIAGDQKVTLVDKGLLGRSGSSIFAAGVINICTPEDRTEDWLKEVVVRGEYLNDQEWVKTLLEEIYPLAMEVDRWGQEILSKPILKRQSSGELIRLRGRGHEHSRISMLDALTTMDTMTRKVNSAGVEVFNRVMITDILVKDGKAAGAVGIDYREGKLLVFLSKALIMAASGCGFKSFFIGHKNLTGEAHRTALEHGVLLRHFDQANSNCTAKIADVHGLNLMIGMGGRFINAKGEEFLSRYDPKLGNSALMPTIVLAFCLENEGGRGPVFLDLSAISHEDRKTLRDLIPEGIAVFESVGIDPFSQPIEWIPAFFGSIVQGGGIHIDTQCRSSLPGLYVVGDSSSSPHQGTASVGGLNLAFCLVSGERAARFSKRYTKEAPPPLMDAGLEEQLTSIDERIKRPLRNPRGKAPDEVISKIQQIMLRGDVAYLVDESSLKKALRQLEEVKELRSKLMARDGHELVKAMEVHSMLGVAEIILRSRLFRKESRGFLYRKDFPLTNNRDWLKWIMVRKDPSTENLELFAADFPTPYVKPPTEPHARFPVIG
jgi:succinate dehydrogenase/fumarate reductase flavoprotein subunit